MSDRSLQSLVKGSEGITDIKDFANAMTEVLAFTCRSGSKEATIFNLVVATGRAAHGAGGFVSYKVAKIRQEGLPRFTLGRNSALETFEDVTDTLSGNPTYLIKLDPHKYAGFDAHYWLKGGNESEISAFLTPEKIRFLESTLTCPQNPLRG